MVKIFVTGTNSSRPTGWLMMLAYLHAYYDDIKDEDEAEDDGEEV